MPLKGARDKGVEFAFKSFEPFVFLYGLVIHLLAAASSCVTGERKRLPLMLDYHSGQMFGHRRIEVAKFLLLLLRLSRIPKN